MLWGCIKMTMFASVKDQIVATKIVAADGSGQFTDIQTAIDDLPSTGGVVYIKEGTYNITSSISITKNNVSLIGAGYSTHISVTNSVCAITGTTISYFTIEGIFLSSDKVGFAPLIGFTSATECIFKNCWFDDSATDAISLDAGIDCLIDGNIINCDATSSNGIALSSGTRRSIVTNNIIKDAPLKGISIGNNADFNIITGNRIEGCSDGIYISDSDSNVVSNNICQGCGDNGIEIGSTSDFNTITNNRCDTNTDHGIQIISGTSDKNLVRCNVLIGNTGGGLLDGGEDTLSGANLES